MDTILLEPSIQFHIALVHALIIDDDINTTGTSNLSCLKGATGRIPLQKQATLMLLSKNKLVNQ